MPEDEILEVGPRECWWLVSAVAAVTQRVEIGTLVLCNGFRNPGLMAKMADTVDEISGGRLVLGIGAGWAQPEFEAFGMPFDHPAGRFEEGIQIIAGLLRKGHSDLEGKFYQTRNCELRPRGPSTSGPPIMIGTSGHGPRLLRLTAEYADIWNTWFLRSENNLQNLLPVLQRVDDACSKAGRDPSTLEKSATIKVEVAPAAPSPMPVPSINGNPQEIADAIMEHYAAGVSNIQIWLEPSNLAGVEKFAAVLEHLDRS